MDGNKDAAVKCMIIGQQALKDGHKARAYKFLSKARRLDPSLPLGELLSSLEVGSKDDEATVEKDPRSPEKEKERRHLETNCSNDGINTQQATKTAPTFSTEQAELVLQIRRTRDYYQILGLNKDCSAEEIRKAYRKISLKVHPDKNKAPGAEEAFKTVAKAFACLSDEELRRKYDQYGPEETDEVAQQYYTRRSQSNGGFYQEMFDADEIFNTFFFGSPYPNSGFRGARFVRTRGMAGHGGGGTRTHEGHFGGLSGLLQLLPILALFFITYFPFSSEPIYKLEQAAPYIYQHFTRNNVVPFFVKSQSFEKDYPPGSPSRRSIEAQVESDYREVLTYNCRAELSMQYWNPSAQTPNCDFLRQLKVY